MVVVMLSLETIIGNAMVILAYKLERVISKQVSNRFIVSLAVSDLIIGIEGYPLFTLYVLNGDRWPLGRAACETWLFLDYTLCLVSILTVLLITADRYLSVCQTASYLKWQSPTKTQVAIFLSWFIPAFIFGIMIYGWSTLTSSSSGAITNESECSAPFLTNPYVNMGMYVVYYWTTLVAMLILYKGIHKAAKNLEQKAKGKERRHIALILSQRLGTQVGVSLMLSQARQREASKMDRNESESVTRETFVSHSAYTSNTMRRYGSEETVHNLEIIREENERSSADADAVAAYCEVRNGGGSQRSQCGLAKKRPSQRSCRSLPLRGTDYDAAASADDDRRHLENGPWDFQAADSLSLLFNDDSLSSVLQLKPAATTTAVDVEPNYVESAPSTIIRRPHENKLTYSASMSEINGSREEHRAPSSELRRNASVRHCSGSWVQRMRKHVARAFSARRGSNALSRSRSTSSFSSCSSSEEGENFVQKTPKAVPAPVSRDESRRNIAKAPVERIKGDSFLSPGGMSRKISSLSSLTRERMLHSIFSPFSAFQRRRKRTKAERRAHKAFRTITFIVGFFAILWSPYYVMATVYGFCRGHCIPSFLYTLSYYMCYLNSSGNPFAYALANQDRSSRRRFRTNFTENQSVALEEAFQESHYPDQNSKKNLAVTLDIPEDRITVWFQNRRAKWRRKEMREREKKRFVQKEAAYARVDYCKQQAAVSSAAQPHYQLAAAQAHVSVSQYYYYDSQQQLIDNRFP